MTMDAIDPAQSSQRMWERFATNGGLTLEQARAASQANALKSMRVTMSELNIPEALLRGASDEDLRDALEGGWGVPPAAPLQAKQIQAELSRRTESVNH